MTDLSIREFCELQTPIFMFDKDGAFVVMKLEQVGSLLQTHRGGNCAKVRVPVASTVVWTGSSPSSG